ncbi:MAG: cytochrome P450 [Deltaproteobacteria bacterium]|nr:cytochrome P450 [Deltaproteobacteria bacterium]
MPTDDSFRFDPFDRDTRRDPYALFARARREHPVFAHTGFPVVSVFRYADVQRILKDPATWSSDFDVPGVDPGEVPDPSMLGQDPPAHTRLRGLVNQAFTPRIVQRLEPRMREIADELVAAALARGEVDLVEALSYPLPVIVIAEIIGVPPEDRERFKAWSDVAVEGLGNGLFVPPTPERLARLGGVRAEMDAYFSALAAERRRHPREDLLTGLVQAELEGSRLSHAEMLRMLILLLVAGNETTTNLIGNLVLTLLEHPAELARLRAERTLLPSAVEEVLRYSSPVQMDPRRATRDLELHGQRIAADQLVVCWLGAANRDAEAFPEPERFDIGRGDNHHLAFGFGPHYCLGANLARIEAQVALAALLDRARAFERVDDAPLPLHPSIVFRGVTRLPLRLHPR